MKKIYKKPNIELFPTRCHVSSLSPDEPEELNSSRRSLLMRVGFVATVGHLSLYGASSPGNGNGNGWGNGNGNAGGNGGGNGNNKP